MIRLKMLMGLLVVSVCVGGCKKSGTTADAPQNSFTQAAVAAGGTLNSDGSVTNANGTVTEPNGTVVPANAAPASQPAGAAMTAAPASSGAANGPASGSAQAAAPVVLSAPAGTVVTVRTTEEVTSSMGDGAGFTGVLERPIVSHGTVIFGKGTPVAGVVVAAKNKGTFKGAGDLGLELTEIGHVRVHTSEFVERAKGRGKRTGAFIGGGGGVGALIGGLAGGGKGALIGGLAGAGAGTAASTSGNKAVVLRPESVITFRLREAVS